MASPVPNTGTPKVVEAQAMGPEASRDQGYGSAENGCRRDGAGGRFGTPSFLVDAILPCGFETRPWGKSKNEDG